MNVLGRSTLALALALALTPVFTACSSSDDDSKPASVQPLDPTGTHYGKTYGEWAGQWATWTYQVPVAGTVEKAECKVPFLDATGAACGISQDPANPVFFLAGNTGGVTQRTECHVPKGKALFFPLANGTSDAAGVAPADVKDSAAYKQDAEALIAQQDPQALSLEVDGTVIDNLTRFAVATAPYSYSLASEPNVYTCVGVNGVTGKFDGWTTGYYVMLPPLAPGDHKIHMTAATKDKAWTLDVSYDPLHVDP